ncbi:variant surface glycoprotein (VSG), putative [Trypanosoma brucei brucei TREU927]|uniref:Variant surface glycoprotein (VSG), putative n=1 Tax=Trypanosoma brucei brucei (strain 927/4 GUTat10.1) TaxID=185431 RepID=Q380V4_TRYB2|nr:variant surface glycoprotein [Trypanosoma brucei brucei TREU927]EAN80677.1 variant surface glycoprotein (VSG), putative [Trypanosoma brucei brucei TREU927]
MYAIMLPMTIVLWLVTKTEGTDIVGGANRQEHAALCKFVAMAPREVEIPTIPAMPEDDLDYIHMVNFSAATGSWQEMFYSDKAAKKTHDNPKSAGQDGRGFEENWPRWTKIAAKKLEATTGGQKNQAGIMELTEDQETLARDHLKHIRTRAHELAKELQSIQPPSDAPKDNTAKETIATAVYGENAKPASNPDPSKVFTGTTTGTRDSVCKAAGGNGNPATALEALTCVCFRGTNNVDPAVCVQAADGGTWEAASTFATGVTAANLGKLAKSCPFDAGQITGTEILAAIANLNDLIHKDTSNAYLGQFASSKCDGNKAQGVCLEFSGFASKAQPIVEQLTWIPPLKNLALGLQTLESNKQRGLQIIEQIKKLKKDAVVIVDSAKATAAALEKIKGGTQKQHTIGQTTTNCSTHTTNQTCIKANCKWEEKDGKGECKSKPGSATPETAGTEGTTKEGGTTAAWCTGHKDKTACENDKTGDKQNCAWRKGKEGETDEPEKEKCRNGSFLVNKKFALGVASAAFAALLF